MDFKGTIIKTKEQIQKEKMLDYYTSNINKSFNMRMEAIKTIIILSIACIVIQALYFKDISMDKIEILAIYFASLVLFILSIVFTIMVYNKNSDYFKSILSKEDDKKVNPNIFMNLALSSFALALILTLLTLASFKIMPSISNNDQLSKIEQRLMNLEKNDAELKNTPMAKNITEQISKIENRLMNLEKSEPKSKNKPMAKSDNKRLDKIENRLSDLEKNSKKFFIELN